MLTQVCFTSRLDGDSKVVQVDDEADEGIVANLAEGELWDLTRPLVGDCRLTLLKYDDPESKTVSHQNVFFSPKYFFSLSCSDKLFLLQIFDKTSIDMKMKIEQPMS